MKSKHLLSIKLIVCLIFIYHVLLLGNDPEVIVPDFQVNEFTETEFSRLNPVTGVAGNGDYVITWQDQRTAQKNIYAQRFSSDGTPLGDNFLVNDDTKKNNRAHFPPAIAVNTNGYFVIVWADSRVSITAPYRLYFQRYDKDGNMLGTNTAIDPNKLSGYRQSSPAVAYSDSGHIIVVWEETLSGGFTDIAMRKLDSQGNYLGEIVMVNDNDVDRRRQHAAIATNNDGNYIIAWQDYSIDFNWGDIHFKRFDSDDSQVGEEVRANDDPEEVMSEQRDVAVAIINSGEFVVSWKDKRNGDFDIFAQRYDAEGQTHSANFRVNDDPGSLDQQNPALAIKTDGICLITWADNRNGGEIYGQLYDKEGATISGNFIINDDTTGIQTYPDIGNNDNDDYIITWQDYRNSNSIPDVYTQKVLSSGTMDGSNIQISDNIWNGNQWSSKVATFTNGTRIVIWQDDQVTYGDISAQVYNNGIYPVGENFNVNGDNRAGFTDLAAGADNRAMVVWTSNQKRNNEYHYYIKGQMISNDGSISGPLITIDSLSSGSGFVSVDYNNGTYVVTWHESQPPDYGNIYARRLDDKGITLGPSFKVNNDMGTTTQDKPDIAINNQGDFLIVWQDSRNNWPKIYAQLYDSDGEMVNSNFRVNHSPTDSLFLFYLPCAAATDSGQFVVAYRTYQQSIENNVNLRFLGSDGSYIGNSLQLNDDPIYDPYGSKEAVNPAISTGDSSRIVVTWENEFENDYYYYHDNLKGQCLISNTKVGPNFSISEDDKSDQNNCAVNLWEKEIFITWEDNRNEIMASDIMATVMDFGNPEITSVSNQTRQPMVFNLSQNYPNPFNPVTSIEYQVSGICEVKLSVYNILGQQVRTLVDQRQNTGNYTVQFDGSGLASGVYFYKLETSTGFVQARKLVLLK